MTHEVLMGVGGGKGVRYPGVEKGCFRGLDKGGRSSVGFLSGSCLSNIILRYSE